MPQFWAMNAWIILHAAAGTLGLICGLPVFLSPKGPWHKKVGRVFFYSLSFSFITAIGIALAKQIPFCWSLVCLAVIFWLPDLWPFIRWEEGKIGFKTRLLGRCFWFNGCPGHVVHLAALPSSGHALGARWVWDFAHGQ